MSDDQRVALARPTVTTPRFISDIVLTIAMRITLLGSGVLTSILTAKALGPGGRGDYAYVTTLGLIAAQLGTLGLATNNARLVAIDERNFSPLAANSFWVATTIGVLTAAMLFLATSLGSSDGLQFGLLSLFIVVPANLYSLLAVNILIGSSKIRTYNFNQLIVTLIQLVSIVVSVTVMKSATITIWANAVAALLGAIFLRIILAKNGASGYRFDTILFRDGLAYSARVYLITLIAFLISRLNIVLLQHFADHTAVGIYSIAAQFSDTMMLLPTTVGMILFPQLIRSGSHGALTKTWRTAIIVGVLMVASSLIVGIAAPFFIPLMFGRAFASSATVLIWLLPGCVALGAGSIFSQYLAARGVPLINILIWIVCLVVMLASDVVLIPVYGAVGAAVSVTASYTMFLVSIVLAAVFDRSPSQNSEPR